MLTVNRLQHHVQKKCTFQTVETNLYCLSLKVTNTVVENSDRPCIIRHSDHYIIVILHLRCVPNRYNGRTRMGAPVSAVVLYATVARGS